ncbi:bacteriohemerythrin [Candidatus Magnetaquicoccus inordinatus]|uniref:bacteriohemerythrin n=1 Tax=Candidatus Magnetaquicoccus inordinatus TaxID=2496818 RepID=UPI00102CFC6C|nr:bacteriohemerythrin [Candidatus Magnetaquicoccus inordinatus]
MLQQLQWDASYHVGLAEIDDDHLRLVGLLNGLIAGLNEQASVERIAGLLNELVNYTAWHFRHEERLMQSYRYPEFIAHKRQHTQLIEEATSCQSRWQSEGLPVVQTVVELLKGWLLNHVLIVDKMLAEYLAERI